MDMNRLEFSENLVNETGKLIRKLMAQGLDVTTKSDRSDFVTNVDKAAEQFIVEAIIDQFGSQDFLTEEKTIERSDSDDLWIIDPIDGTLNFIYQRKNFAISLAYYHQKKPVFGIIYDVMRDEMVVGIYGQGLFVNGIKMNPLPLHTEVEDSLISVDHQTIDLCLNHKFINEFVAQRYLGSAALEICDVALNRLQVYVAGKLMAWDIAAGLIILHEAGAVTNKIGDLVFSDESIPFIAAENQNILSFVLEASHGIF